MERNDSEWHLEFLIKYKDCVLRISVVNYCIAKMKPNLSKLLEAMKPNFLKQIIIDLQVEVYLPFDGFPSLPALFIRTAILR